MCHSVVRRTYAVQKLVISFIKICLFYCSVVSVARNFFLFRLVRLSISFGGNEHCGFCAKTIPSFFSRYTIVFYEMKKKKTHTYLAGVDCGIVQFMNFQFRTWYIFESVFHINASLQTIVLAINFQLYYSFSVDTFRDMFPDFQ